MGIRKEVLVNTYPDRYGLDFMIENQSMFLESGRIKFFTDKLFRIAEFSSADFRSVNTGYSFKYEDGTDVSEPMYKAFPFDEFVVDKTIRYLYQYDIDKVYYIVKDNKHNDRYTELKFEKVTILNLAGVDVSDKFEPVFVIHDRDIEVSAGFIDNPLTPSFTADENGFLQDLKVQCNFIMPLRKIVGELSTMDINTELDYSNVDLLEGLMFSQKDDNFMYLENQIELGRIDSFDAVTQSTLNFFIFVRIYLNPWDSPSKFGTVEIDLPLLEEVTDSKYQTEPISFYNDMDYVLTTIEVLISTDSANNKVISYNINDMYSKHVNSIPEVIDARNVYTRKTSGDQDILILRKSFNSIGERLDDLYKELTELQGTVNNELPTKINTHVQELYTSINDVDDKYEQLLLDMESEVAGVLKYAKMFEQMGDLLLRPTITLFNSIQPNITNRDNLRIEYATLSDRLKALDKDIYSNILNIKSLIDRMVKIESLFLSSEYNENVSITRVNEENGTIELTHGITSISNITLVYTNEPQTIYQDYQRFNFLNYFWIKGQKPDLNDMGTYLDATVTNRILFDNFTISDSREVNPFGTEVTYQIDNVPIMFYNPDDQGLRQYVKDYNHIESQFSQGNTKVNVVYIDNTYKKFDDLAGTYQPIYDDYDFVAGNIDLTDIAYFDKDKELQNLADGDILDIDFYINSNDTSLRDLVKSNGKYVDSSQYFNEYMVMINQNYDDPNLTQLDIQLQLDLMFDGHDYVYTFEANFDEVQRKYSVTIYFIVNKFNYNSELIVPNYIELLHRQLKKYGYAYAQDIGDMVDIAWSDFRTGDLHNDYIHTIYDNDDNLLTDKYFYILKSIKYRLHKMATTDSRDILTKPSDFVIRINKGKFNVEFIDGQKMAYSTITDVRVSYLLRLEKGVSIEDTIITMPHFNIYAGQLRLQEVRSYFEILKRLTHLSNLLGTLNPLNKFYEDLYYYLDYGDYAVNVRGVTEADAISLLDSRLTTFKDSYMDINKKVFGTMLLVDNTYIEFDKDVKDLGRAVFGLRFDEESQDVNKLLLDDSQIFFEGFIYDVYSTEIDISYLRYGTSQLNLYAVLNRINKTATYLMSEGIISGDLVQLTGIRVLKDLDFNLCTLRISQENMHYAPFTSIYDLSKLDQEFNKLKDTMTNLNRTLSSNPLFMEGALEDEVAKGQITFMKNESTVILKHYYDYIDDILAHVHNPLVEFDHKDKDISERTLVSWAVTDILDKTLTELYLSEWVTDVDLVIDGVLQLANLDFQEERYSTDFGLDPLTLTLQSLPHEYSAAYGKLITKYNYSGSILHKQVYPQPLNFFVKRLTIPTDYLLDQVKYTVNYLPLSGIAWNGNPLQDMSLIQLSQRDYMVQTFFTQDVVTGLNEIQVDDNNKSLRLQYNQSKKYPYLISTEQIEYIFMKSLNDDTRRLIYAKDLAYGLTTTITENNTLGLEELILNNVELYDDESNTYAMAESVEVVFKGIYLDTFQSDFPEISGYFRLIDETAINITAPAIGENFYTMNSDFADKLTVPRDYPFAFQEGRNLYTFTREYSAMPQYKEIFIYYKIPFSEFDLSLENVDVEVIGKIVAPYYIHDTFRYSIYAYIDKMTDSMSELLKMYVDMEKFVYRPRVFRGLELGSDGDYYVYAPIFFMHTGEDLEEDKIVLQVHKLDFNVLDILDARYSKTNMLLFQNIGDRFEWIESYLQRRSEATYSSPWININEYTTADLMLFEETCLTGVSGDRLLRGDSWKFTKSVFSVVEDVLTIKKRLNLNNESFNDLPTLLSNVTIELGSYKVNDKSASIQASQTLHINGNNRALEKRFAFATYFDDLVPIDSVNDSITIDQ